MFMRGSSRHGDINGVIFDTDGAYEGRYGYKRGLIWVHLRADMCSCEWAIMGLQSRAVSAWVTKHFVTIFSKTCNNKSYFQ